MKLYATTTDSKGKKEGKGDSEYLEVMLSDRNENKFLIAFNGDKIQILNYCDGKKTIIEYSQGKKQKGEKICKHCNNTVYENLNYCYNHKPNF